MTGQALRAWLRKFGGWIGLLVLAVTAAAWAFRPRPVVVDVAAVAVGRFEQSLEEDGRLRVKQRYVITAPTAGDLARPALKVGDSVRAGQVVATLSPTAPQMIDARTRRVLQERAASAEAQLVAAKAGLERLKTDAAQVLLEAQRAQRLANEEFLSAAARDQAVLALHAQERALEVGQAQVLAAEHALLEARAALQQVRSDTSAGARADARSEAPTGSPTEASTEARSEAGSAARSAAERRPAAAGGWALRSPATGRVMRVLSESGGPVGAGDALLEIADTRELEAVIDVLSGDALRVPPGAAVQLSLGAGAAPLAGRVSRVEPLAFTKVSALGIEEQRVNLVIDFDRPAARAASAAAASAVNASGNGNGNGNVATASPAAPLGDGFRVDARVLILAHDDALLLPAAALVRDGPRWSVFVVSGGRAERREVRLRDRNADQAWVTGGVAAGDRVVLYPGSNLASGQRIAARELQGEGSR